MWKYWILGNLVKHPNNSLILNELERIAKYPTIDEIENEVYTEVISILNCKYKKNEN